MSEYHTRRIDNQPISLPSAGTTFVPPYPWHVGGMLRELNLVGLKLVAHKLAPNLQDLLLE